MVLIPVDLHPEVRNHPEVSGTATQNGVEPFLVRLNSAFDPLHLTVCCDDDADPLDAVREKTEAADKLGIPPQADVASLAPRHEPPSLPEPPYEPGECGAGADLGYGFVIIGEVKIRVGLGQVKLDVLAGGRGRSGVVIASGAHRDTNFLLRREISDLEDISIACGVERRRD